MNSLGLRTDSMLDCLELLDSFTDPTASNPLSEGGPGSLPPVFARHPEEEAEPEGDVFEDEEGLDEELDEEDEDFDDEDFDDEDDEDIDEELDDEIEDIDIDEEDDDFDDDEDLDELDEDEEEEDIEGL
jgi:hypothetical protein